MFSYTDDFSLLTRIAREYPTLHEIKLQDKAHYEMIIEETINDKNTIPVFLKDNSGELTIISSYSKDIESIERGFYLVYLGKPIESE